MDMLVRICADVSPDSACTGKSGDSFVPLSALGPRAWVAVCVPAHGGCNPSSLASFQPLGDVKRGSFIFAMDESKDFGTTMLRLVSASDSRPVAVVPLDPRFVEWGTAVVIVLLAVCVGYASGAAVVVSRWWRIRRVARF